MTRQETLNALIVAANKADDAYSATIRSLYGPKATRWSLSGAQACHPAINAAFKAKLDADAAFNTAFADYRTTRA